MIRSSGVRNQAFAGESGKKNLPWRVRTYSKHRRTWWNIPEQNRDDECDASGDDHEPIYNNHSDNETLRTIGEER